MRKGAIAVLLAVAAGAAAGAQMPADPRLRVIRYQPQAVTTLRVATGYIATVVLPADDRIQSVAVGNSGAWDVSANKSGDHLFVRPTAAASGPTNVEVVTDSRHYRFLLQSTFDGDPDALLELRIEAEEPASPPPGPPPRPATAETPYRLSGARAIRPASVTEDGDRTGFDWPAGASLPATYAIDDVGHETLVTLRRQDDRWTVDRVWRRYRFRLGNAVAEARR